MIRIRHILFLYLLLAGSCVERIEVPVIESKPVLVVDGAITDQPGRHTVKLYLSTKLEDDNEIPTPVTLATVSIVEDGTLAYPLTEVSPGIYETEDGVAGVPGRKYHLYIRTEEFKEYESEPSILRPAGTLENIHAEFMQNSINLGTPDQPQDALFIYADGTGQNSGLDPLRWRWKAVYQVTSAPEKKVKRLANAVSVPDPPPCSGWALDEEENLYMFDVCTCCDCWVTEYSDYVAVSDPLTHSGGSYDKVYLGLIPIKSIYFHNKLVIEVEQLSVSDDVYNFWKLVKIQQEGAGDIFQPNVVKIRGNISSRTNPSEEVFGVFSVSATQVQRIVIQHSDVLGSVPLPEIVNDECRIVSGGSYEKPPFY